MDKDKENQDKRMSDGFIMILGDEVDFDSEAEETGSESKVGTKVPLPPDEDEEDLEVEE